MVSKFGSIRTSSSAAMRGIRKSVRLRRTGFSTVSGKDGVVEPRMSDARKAVFLSYASQSAEVARKTCDALRAASVEVQYLGVPRTVWSFGLFLAVKRRYRGHYGKCVSLRSAWVWSFPNPQSAIRNPP